MSSENFNLERNNLEKLYDINLQDSSTKTQETITTSQEPSPQTEDSITTSTTQTETIPTETPKSNLENLYQNAEPIEISNFEKLEYGFDKSTNVVGNIFRIGKAKFQDIIDKDKTFKDYILENEQKRKEGIEKEHWKFIDNKEAQESGLVTVGEIASMLTDPYYIAGYAFGAPLLTNPVTSAALNGFLIAGDTAIGSLAKTGEIDWKGTAISGGVGAAIGAVLPIGGKLIKKVLPNSTKAEVEQIANWLDDKIAKKNNITVPELKKIQQVTNAPSVVKANNEILTWNRNFVAPIANEAAALRATEKKIFEESKYLIQLRKLSKERLKERKIGEAKFKEITKPIAKQIVENRNAIIDARKQSEIIKKELITKQQTKLQKWAELVANRDTKILEELRKNESTVDWAVRSLLSATVKPLVGAGAGATFGTLFGDEETDIMYWAAAGAAAGQMQKMIQRSAKFGTQEKGKILGLIDREVVALNMQKVRSLLSSTSATKLNSYGGATEKISRMLLRDIDSSVQEKSSIAVAEQMDRYFFRKASDLTKKYTPEEQLEAVSIVRGKEITNTTSENAKNLAEGIVNYLDEFKKLYQSAGFFPKKEVENYFPRVLDWGKINQDPKKFKEVLTNIYRSLDVKGTISTGSNAGRDKAVVAAENYIAGHKASGESVFNRLIMEDIFGRGAKGRPTRVSEKDNVFVRTPVSEHITQERTLNGPYKLVEKVLEDNGYLVNDAGYILSNLVNKSTKSIAFARQFGTNGELLKPFFTQIRDKYLNSGLKEDAARKASIKESNLVIDTIDSYFDRYGQHLNGAAQASASILATLSNLNMLGRVTISSLGDLVQPFQNSSQFSSILKGWKQTALRAKNETGLAKELNYDISNELQASLIRSAGMKGDINSATAWMGEKPTQKLNNLFFKGVGLEWLTGYARRFAYNTGTADAYSLSKQLYNIVNKGAGIESSKAKEVINFLQKYGINQRQGLQIGENKSFEEAIKLSANKKLLNQAGIISANRDALLPQVSNRLLFTQSQNAWVRIWGQFLSWSMAKSAQTNKILQRIENGNTKTLIKTLAVIPIYSGIQSLRELAKYGEIVTDYDANTAKWWAEGGKLSGQFGWLPELVANRFVGPGSREPWYTFAPFFQFLNAPLDAFKEAYKGKGDRALQILSDKVVPLPNWRATIGRIFTEGSPKDIKIGGTSFSGGKLKPFSTGGLAENSTVTEDTNNNLIANADLVPTMYKEYKSKEKDIIPPEKPKDFYEGEGYKGSPDMYPDYEEDKKIGIEKPIDTQVENLLKDKYKKVGKLTGEISNAGKPIYLTPEGEKVSEKSITIKYNNEWLNVPSIYDGYKVNENTIRELLNKNLINPTSKHKTLEEAITTAEKRSPSLIKNEEVTSQMDNLMLPKEKPSSIKYSKIPALEKSKKDWLMSTAEKVYNINKDNIIPNDIILAINSEETGWGTSSFLKRGSNNLFNIQSFDKDIPHIPAREGKAMIKKYDSEEDSIKDFLNMVQNSKKYSTVRETIKNFNEGKASKNDIIDALAATGYAENKKWSSNVKDILNTRIAGKNKDELEKLANSLYDTEK